MNLLGMLGKTLRNLMAHGLLNQRELLSVGTYEDSPLHLTLHWNFRRLQGEPILSVVSFMVMIAFLWKIHRSLLVIWPKYITLNNWPVQGISQLWRTSVFDISENRYLYPDMPFSHHSHSGQFCHHAADTLEEVVRTAIKKKMQLFALTEHMPRERDDLYPEEVIRWLTFYFLSSSHFLDWSISDTRTALCAIQCLHPRSYPLANPSQGRHWNSDWRGDRLDSAIIVNMDQ